MKPEMDGLYHRLPRLSVKLFGQQNPPHWLKANEFDRWLDA